MHTNKRSTGGWTLARVALQRCLVLVLVAGPMLCAQPDWPLWHSYATHFLDADGRILDHDAGDRTTSEGQSYALFFHSSRMTGRASTASSPGPSNILRKAHSTI